LRLVLFPRGRTFSSPADELGQRLVEAIIKPSPTRDRLASCAYLTREPSNHLARLQEAIEQAEKVKPLERRVFDARKRGEIDSADTPGQIDEAEQKGILTVGEAKAVREFDALVMDLTGVDDFDPSELGAGPAEPKRERPQRKKASRTKNAAKAAPPPAVEPPPEPTDGQEP
jgi:acyl-CoA dehydrogenase